MSWEQSVLIALSEDGLRLTNPRRAIVADIAARTEPFTAEQLVAEIAGVGRATVYRTLEVLTAGHWLARLHHEDGEHAYIASEPHKHQLVCTSCGRAETFDTCDLDGLMNELSRRTGFQIQGHALEAFGLCLQCQRRQAFGRA